ncbi:hypothetical protein J3F81_006030, partial [Coemansia sp. RSA 371]
PRTRGLDPRMTWTLHQCRHRLFLDHAKRTTSMYQHSTDLRRHCRKSCTSSSTASWTIRSIQQLV